MAERILVDTGPLVAVLSARDQHHATCVEELRRLPAPLFTCWPVLTEAGYLLRHSPQAVRRLFDSVSEGTWLRLIDLDAGAARWTFVFFSIATRSSNLKS